MTKFTLDTNDGDFAVEVAARLQRLHADACVVLAALEQHDFDWRGPFWVASAQCRTLLRLAVLGALLRASDAMAGPAFRHQIAEAAQSGADGGIASHELNGRTLRLLQLRALSMTDFAPLATWLRVERAARRIGIDNLTALGEFCRAHNIRLTDPAKPEELEHLIETLGQQPKPNQP